VPDSATCFKLARASATSADAFDRDGASRAPARTSLLHYDHGVRPDRRQCYARVAVHLFEVERLAPRREIYLSYCSPVRQDIDAKP
jgi:hypothetical protein